MSARPLVLGNWKMNLDFVEALHLVQQLGVVLKNRPLEHVDAGVVVPFVDLRTVSSLIDADRLTLTLGAQHASRFESGAHTGEISVGMLARLNVTWVLVGHSERRTHYAMTDDVVAATLRTVAGAGLRPVLCVGEDAAVRERGDEYDFVEAQVRHALEGLDATLRPLVTLAYEPIWAIGTGVTASSEQVRAMTEFLHSLLDTLGFVDTTVLYGGSVTGENATTLLVDGHVDGFLVGGASLKAESFLAILQACEDCYARKR